MIHQLKSHCMRLGLLLLLCFFTLQLQASKPPVPPEELNQKKIEYLNRTDIKGTFAVLDSGLKAMTDDVRRHNKWEATVNGVEKDMGIIKKKYPTADNWTPQEFVLMGAVGIIVFLLLYTFILNYSLSKLRREHTELGSQFALFKGGNGSVVQNLVTETAASKELMANQVRNLVKNEITQLQTTVSYLTDTVQALKSNGNQPAGQQPIAPKTPPAIEEAAIAPPRNEV
ncbi:MAG: hypothetical protein V4543_10650, partial [Bacteroidota bacterium]